MNVINKSTGIQWWFERSQAPLVQYHVGINPSLQNILGWDDYIFILHLSRQCYICLHCRHAVTELILTVHGLRLLSLLQMQKDETEWESTMDQQVKYICWEIKSDSFQIIHEINDVCSQIKFSFILTCSNYKMFQKVCPSGQMFSCTDLSFLDKR